MDDPKQVDVEAICAQIGEQVQLLNNASFTFQKINTLCREVGTNSTKIRHDLSLVTHVLNNLKDAVGSLSNSVGFDCLGLSGSSQISSGSNVPYIKVPDFDGNPVKQEFDRWKLRVNLYSKLTKMDAQTEALFVALKLQGPAFQLYSDLPEQDRMVSSKIFEVLDINFKFQNRGFQKLQCISQGDYTIYEYYEKLLEYLAISNITNDVQRVYYFERGLGPQYKEKMTQKFDNLERALDFALYIEATVDQQKQAKPIQRADINPAESFALTVIGLSHTISPGEKRIVRATLPQEGSALGVVQQCNILGLTIKTKIANSVRGSVRIMVINPTEQSRCVRELQGQLVFHAVNENILLNQLSNSALYNEKQKENIQ